MFMTGKIQYCKVEKLTSNLSIYLLKFQSKVFLGESNDLILKFKYKSKGPRIAKKILKNNKAGRFDA